MKAIDSMEEYIKNNINAFCDGIRKSGNNGHDIVGDCCHSEVVINVIQRHWSCEAMAKAVYEIVHALLYRVNGVEITSDTF